MALIIVASTGCVGRTAVPANEGRAYVVVGSVFGSSTYLCENVEGRPTCWEVIEEEAP